MNKSAKLLIAAAGTGGHVMPALAVAELVSKEKFQVHWAGTEHGLEKRLLSDHTFPFHCFKVAGIRGQGAKRLIQAPYAIARAYSQARRLIKSIQPSCILTMGGYISVPIGLAAYTSGIPLIIHEQNAVCGLANRLLGPLAQTRLQGFPHTFKSSRPVITTGNPVRQSLLTLESPNKRLEARQGPLRLLVFGGSQGARFLNHVLPEVAALIPEKERPAIYHQCGSSQLQTTQNAYSRLGVNATIVPYIEDMAAAYSWADLVISRAGAMTITEIATAGAASMLVPYPHSRDSHQTANAKQLTDIDAAVMLHEEQFDKHTVAEQLRAWQKNRQRLLEMANNSSQLASTHAAMEMANMCLTYLKDTP